VQSIDLKLVLWRIYGMIFSRRRSNVVQYPSESFISGAERVDVLRVLGVVPRLRNRNRKLDISTAPTKARSWEPAYSQALIQNKIDKQRVRSRESGRQTVRWLWRMVFGVEMGREVGRRRQMRMRINGHDIKQCEYNFLAQRMSVPA